MAQTCRMIQQRLDSLFLSGKLTFEQVARLAEFTQSLVVLCESGKLAWDSERLGELFDGSIASMLRASK